MGAEFHVEHRVRVLRRNLGHDQSTPRGALARERPATCPVVEYLPTLHEERLVLHLVVIEHRRVREVGEVRVVPLGSGGHDLDQLASGKQGPVVELVPELRDVLRVQEVDEGIARVLVLRELHRQIEEVEAPSEATPRHFREQSLLCKNARNVPDHDGRLAFPGHLALSRSPVSARHRSAHRSS